MEIPDRKKAIIESINDLRTGDILIIAGKGHEKIQINNNSTKFFSDYKTAKNQLIIK